MRNGPKAISMFRLSSVALGILSVATFVQNAQASVVFATEAQLNTTFGGPAGTPNLELFGPPGAPVSSPATLFGVSLGGGFGSTNVTFSEVGVSTFSNNFVRLNEGSNTFALLFPNGTPLLGTNIPALNGVRFDFSNPIGGFGITLQENLPATTSSTFIQALGLGGALVGPSVTLNGSGTGGSLAFLGLESSLNDITSIIVGTSSSSFIMNSPTFFMHAPAATGVPEPGTWLMMGLGTFLYGAGRRRKKKNAVEVV